MQPKGQGPTHPDSLPVATGASGSGSAEDPPRSWKAEQGRCLDVPGVQMRDVMSKATYLYLSAHSRGQLS